MKKIYNVMMLAAVAAAALVSCAKEMDKPEAEQKGEGIQITVVTALQETKTYMVDDNTAGWSAGDKVDFVQSAAGEKVQSEAAVISEGNATFTATVANTGSFYAYYPTSSRALVNNHGEVKVLEEQYPSAADTFDPTADVLVSDYFDVAAAGSTSTDPTELRFKRLGAFIKLKFVDNTTGNILGSEHASTIAIQNDGEGAVKLTGKIEVSPEGILATTRYYYTVTAHYEAGVFDVDDNYAYFGVLPNTLKSGSDLIFTAETEHYRISKTVTLPNDVTYESGDIQPITVSLGDSNVAIKSASVSRVWGLYSTSVDAWNVGYGGTANTDRNVAIDDSYIYICETVQNVPKIWAISLADNTQVKSVSVEGIKTTSFWPTACPRVLKNTDPSINGGKDVLVVSSMSNEQDALYLYFYLDGIDNKPTPVQMGGYITGRRLGDTFTHWGTLQKGMFFFKDANAANMMSYKIANTSGWNWSTVKNAYATEGTIQKVAAQANIIGPTTGVGGYFPYPNDKNNGFFGIRSDVQAYKLQFVTDAWGASGLVDDAVSTSTGSGYFKNATCALYFEVGAYKYVVYTRQVAGNAGGVMFLRGSYTDSYADILNARIAGGGASAVFSIAANSTDAAAENPKYSGNGGFDLAAYKVGDDVYVAAVKQNVGLSLFKVTAE